MKPFTVHILGSGSAIPTLHRNPSSQHLRVDTCCILIDCAEGTQLQLKRFNLSPMKIDHVLISHLHGDHYFGLIGLISSMHLAGRINPLFVYGPPALYDILTLQLALANTQLRYRLEFIPLQDKPFTSVFADDLLEIAAFKVKHRIPCWGFLVRQEADQRNIKKSFLSQYRLSHEELKAVKEGADYVNAQGEVIPNEQITCYTHPAGSYAYCTDTLYTPELSALLQNVTVLYHEATFMQMHEKEAAETYHSTGPQAARMAKNAGAKRLIIGHFSSRYKDLTPLLDEARLVFDQTEMATDGMCFQI